MSLDDEAINKLPYFALGMIDRDDITASLNALWESTTEISITAEAQLFISAIVDIIERQNQLADVDTGKVIDAIITMAEGALNRPLYPGDPMRLLLYTLAFPMSIQNAVMDWNQKQNFLRTSTGPYLEALSELLAVFRLQAFPAKTVLRYSLSELRQVATAIPQGTRATADGRIFFATDTLLLIPAGQLYGDVSATCLTNGVEANGLISAQINRAVDVVAFVNSVENITETTGGSDIEDDESLRNRTRQSPGRFSTAGARLAYLFYTLTAHGNIGDATIVGPEDRDGERLGEVDVFVMLKGGGIPQEDGAEINAVIEALNVENVRPLTDKVNVKPIKTEPINYTIKWFITSTQGVEFAQIEERIKTAVSRYETWQIERIGRDINPDELVRRCREAGAKRIELTGLEFTRLGFDTVAHIESSEIIVGGIEGE